MKQGGGEKPVIAKGQFKIMALLPLCEIPVPAVAHCLRLSEMGMQGSYESGEEGACLERGFQALQGEENCL